MGSVLLLSPPPQYYPGGQSLVLPRAESKRQEKRLFFPLLLSLLIKLQGKASFQQQAVNAAAERFLFYLFRLG